MLSSSPVRRTILHAAVSAALLVGLVPIPAAAADPVLTMAGDIADCGRSTDAQTANLIASVSGTVVALGDNTYPTGTLSSFRACYEPTWGRYKSRTRPVAGNHEYEDPGAAGYFSYFGSAAGDPRQGWYSFNAGAWHAVVLNSNCAYVGGCAKGSVQEKWLARDLAANARTCTVAFFHHPRFTSTRSSPDGRMAAIWNTLYTNGVDVIVTGHSHNYERFAPQTPAGTRSSLGIRQFVVGTGGAKLTGMRSAMSNSESRNVTTHGILKLTLHAGSYDWAFVPVAGQTFRDAGSTACHGRP